MIKDDKELNDVVCAAYKMGCDQTREVYQARIEKLEADLEVATMKRLLDSERIEKLEAVTKDDAKWLAAYHKWCGMNGCAPSSSDLIAARERLEGRDDPAG